MRKDRTNRKYSLILIKDECSFFDYFDRIDKLDDKNDNVDTAPFLLKIQLKYLLFVLTLFYRFVSFAVVASIEKTLLSSTLLSEFLWLVRMGQPR